MDALRIVVKIHRRKGLDIACSDDHQTAVTPSTGNSYNDRRALSAALSNIGEHLQRQKLDGWKSTPGTANEVLLTIADTQAAREGFGMHAIVVKAVGKRRWRRVRTRILQMFAHNHSE
jgi:hypothetical protein